MTFEADLKAKKNIEFIQTKDWNPINALKIRKASQYYQFFLLF